MRVSPEPQTALAPDSPNSPEVQQHRKIRQSLDERNLRLVRQRLPAARVAGPGDRATMVPTQKAQISTVKALGEGAFGVVDLVLVETVDQPLLCVRKKLLMKSEHNNNNPQFEVEFLNTCSGCPFVVQMWSHVVGLYDYTLLLEYCPYGSLEKLLLVVSESRSAFSNACFACVSVKLLGTERFIGFTEQEARFYAACCILGLEEMHAKHILHRDIKPSNLLLAENCYVKLGDLGLCKHLGKDGLARTTTGTPGYMAPEVLRADSRKTGYSYPADMWSLGIMLWELVHGLPPRWAPMSWYLTPTLHFPERFSPALRSLLTGLLEKQPQARMPLKQCRSHAWFAGLDWEALEAQKLPAPAFKELERVHIHARLAAHMAV